LQGFPFFTTGQQLKLPSSFEIRFKKLHSNQLDSKNICLILLLNKLQFFWSFSFSY
jgi:hypothetical protein